MKGESCWSTSKMQSATSQSGARQKVRCDGVGKNCKLRIWHPRCSLNIGDFWRVPVQAMKHLMLKHCDATGFLHAFFCWPVFCWMLSSLPPSYYFFWDVPCIFCVGSCAHKNAWTISFPPQENSGASRHPLQSFGWKPPWTRCVLPWQL